MKTKSPALSLFLLLFSMFMFVSCAEKKAEKKSETIEETNAVVEYQCPMDCEDGKTYHEAANCPVCKMDLKEVDAHHAETCKKHKDGNCTCQEKKCKCKDCKEHAKEMTCEQHKDGNCTCEGEQCKCKNCKQHAAAMTCEQHKDGKCTCEGEKCGCANCVEHS